MDSFLFDVSLASQRMVSAESVHIGSTYQSLLVGIPNDSVNESILAEIPEQMRTIFGDYPISILEPLISCSEHELPFSPGERCVVASMPRFTVAARFVSATPVKIGDGSVLTVVWFQDVSFPFLDSRVRPLFEELDWDSVARDFYL